MKHWTVLVILVPALFGCSSPPPRDLPTGIAVTAVERGRLSGARAYYAVHAPVRSALDVIIGFDHWAEFRPGVVEARSIAASPEGGEAYVRLMGAYAADINASCLYTISEDDGVYRVEYQLSDDSFSLWALQSAFTLTPAKDGEWTIVDQTVMYSTLSSNREATIATVRADAEAIKRRVEEVAGGK